VLGSLGCVDVVSFVAYAAFFVDAAATAPHSAVWLVALGMSLVCAVLWVVARLQLGASFAARAVAKRLVTTGLYARLRHPIYVFGTMAFLLVVLALLGSPALVVWAGVLAIQVLRARREERVLAQAFGDEYETWRATTWF
jgi:protein-S-isoprenylcysteine O-methyltransferase Ste14